MEVQVPQTLWEGIACVFGKLVCMASDESKEEDVSSWEQSEETLVAEHHITYQG